MHLKTKDKPAKAAEALRPYVKRAIDDPELREDLVAAFAAARELYDQVSNRHGIKGKADKISDKDFQKDFQHLVADISDAADRLKTAGEHKARNRVLLLTGLTLGALFNPWTGQATRDWIMNRVSGENGFEEYGESLGSETGNGGASSG
jgi:soluble cytochrome b562